MKQSLQFVRGAIASKDLVPILTHLHIYDGRMQGSNGRITIDCPCPDLKGIEATVPMTDFTKAVDACDGEPNIKIDGQFMEVRKGAFKAKLPLEDHKAYPKQVPTAGTRSEMSVSFLEEIKILQPFISNDASRPWSCGILFQEGRAYATNNAVIASLPAFQFPTDTNIPSFLVDELLRISHDIHKAESDGESITFFYENGGWCRSVLSALGWPDVSKMIPKTVTGVPITDTMRQALTAIRPFCPDSKVPIIVTSENGFSTRDGDKSATFGGFSLPEGMYRAENLELVLGAATEIDFSKYPQPVTFKGPNMLSGLMMGVK